MDLFGKKMSDELPQQLKDASCMRSALAPPNKTVISLLIFHIIDCGPKYPGSPIIYKLYQDWNQSEILVLDKKVNLLYFANILNIEVKIQQEICYLTYQSFPADTANSLQTISNIKYLVKNDVDVELIFPLREKAVMHQLKKLRSITQLKKTFM